jgi:hypothetical protein
MQIEKETKFERLVYFTGINHLMKKSMPLNRNPFYRIYSFLYRCSALIFLLFMAVLLGTASGKDYRGAELRTKQAFTYGRFVVRMKSAQLSGMLSSFFTYHEIISLNDWNEIDIETMGRYSDRIQFNTITPVQQNHVMEQLVKFNPRKAFHVLAIEWTPDYVAWWVDSAEVYRQTDSHILTLQYAQKLMMNIWPPASVDWAGVFDPSKLPVYAYYDWVEYYSYTPGVGDNFTLQWRDDFTALNSVRWEKGTHTWDGNNCNFIADNAVFKDGYFILCLTMPSPTGYNNAPIEDADADAPYMQWARRFDDEIFIYFSENLDASSAAAKSNYILSGVTILSAELLSNLRTVKLVIDNYNPLTAYNLFVSNIKDTAVPAHTMTLTQTVVKVPLAKSFTIDAGATASGSYLGDQIWDYSLEYGRSGGTVTQHSGSLDFADTDEDALYRTELRGINFYDLRLADGFYDVTLMMAETEFSAAGQRVFDVISSGQTVIDDLDIFGEAGANRACVKVIKNVEVSNRRLQLYFKASKGQPTLSAIKVKRLASGFDHGAITPQQPGIKIFPNPFNPVTNVSYQLQDSAEIQLDLFDMLGARVKTVSAGRQIAGSHLLRLDGTGLSAGVYFCRLMTAGRILDVQKAIYIK